MKKTIFSLLASFCLAVSVQAEEVNALVVHLLSGKQIACLLTDKPRITYADGDVVITAASTVLRYALSDVRKCTFEKRDASAVNTVTAPSASVKVVGGQITCSGLPAASMVSVYTVDGKLAASAQTDASGSTTVTLPTKGQVYVVRTAVASFKIINR